MAAILSRPQCGKAWSIILWYCINMACNCCLYADQVSNLQCTPHSLPVRASYGMSIVSILEQIRCVILILCCSMAFVQLLSRPEVILNPIYYRLRTGSLSQVKLRAPGVNTLRPGQHGRHFSRRHFQIQIRQWKCFNFDKNFIEVCSQGSN